MRSAQNRAQWAMLTAMRDQAFRAASGEPVPDGVTPETWATLAAVQATVGEVYNVGGGETATVWEILGKLENLIGCRAMVKREPARPGRLPVP